MKYIQSKNIDYLEDDTILFVDRDIVNARVAEFISTPQVQSESLILLLDSLSDILQKETQTNKLVRFVPLQIKDIKKFFKNYASFPNTTFLQDKT